MIRHMTGTKLIFVAMSVCFLWETVHSTSATGRGVAFQTPTRAKMQGNLLPQNSRKNAQKKMANRHTEKEVPKTVRRSAGRESLTIDSIFNSDRFHDRLISEIVWLPDASAFLYHQTIEGKDTLQCQEVESGRVKQVADWATVERALVAARPNFRPPALDNVNTHPEAGRETAISPDGRFYLSSARGDLFLLDLQTGQPRYLTNNPADERFAAFSPDGSQIAFTRCGDLFSVDMATGAEKQLTHRNGNDNLLNGESDWVYEEELDVKRSFWWSPQSDRILYVQYDTSAIVPFPIVDHLDPASAVEWQRHPAAGAANSRVKLLLLDVHTGTSRLLFDAGVSDAYLPRAGWWPDGSCVWFQTLNREQNRLEFRTTHPETADDKVILVDEDFAWVDVPDPPFFVDAERFVRVTECGGFRHITLHRRDGTRIRQLTRGDWQVDEILGLTKNPTQVLLRGNAEDPRESHLYRVSIEGGELQRLSSSSGWHQASVSPDTTHMLDTYSDRKTPPRIDLLEISGRKMRTICAGGIPALASTPLAATELGSLPADDGTKLFWSMIRPANFDPCRKYPVLVYVYGGPNAQMVTNAWPGSIGLFLNYLANKGLIVFTLDNRGSSRRGRAFEKAIYRRLGQVELADQIRGVKYLKSLPYVDAERIGVYGGSYGGYMTLMCMNNAPEHFRVGVAYAPVTDWALYDSVYTERYMDRPEENPEGYRLGAPLHFASGMTGHLLICHGTADNNVHLKNTVQMTDAYIRAGKQVELMLYPRIRHGIRRSKYRVHFHTLKSEFLERFLIQGGPR